MVRKIITINEEKCNGCGLCADACHEGAIEMRDGKAVLTREDYCDGLGDCLPACPVDAITIEEREAPAYDEAAVLAAKEKRTAPTPVCGSPGSQSKELHQESCATVASSSPAISHLSQWPVQIKLAPIKAPYFNNANLLVAADCTAYAYGNFHHDFIRDHITLIGCPKLDSVDYSEKLTAILSNNAVKNVTVVRMEVPCCGGIEYAVKKALQVSGKRIPWSVVTISTEGKILE